MSPRPSSQTAEVYLGSFLKDQSQSSERPLCLRLRTFGRHCNKMFRKRPLSEALRRKFRRQTYGRRKPGPQLSRASPDDCSAITCCQKSAGSIAYHGTETRRAASPIQLPARTVVAKGDSSCAHRDDLVLRAAHSQEITAGADGGYGPALAVEMADGARQADDVDIVQPSAPDVKQEVLRASVEFIPTGTIPAQDQAEIADGQKVLGVWAPEAVKRTAGSARHTFPVAGGRMPFEHEAFIACCIHGAVLVRPQRKDGHVHVEVEVLGPTRSIEAVDLSELTRRKDVSVRCAVYGVDGEFTCRRQRFPLAAVQEEHRALFSAGIGLARPRVVPQAPELPVGAARHGLPVVGLRSCGTCGGGGAGQRCGIADQYGAEVAYKQSLVFGERHDAQKIVSGAAGDTFRSVVADPVDLAAVPDSDDFAPAHGQGAKAAELGGFKQFGGFAASPQDEIAPKAVVLDEVSPTCQQYSPVGQ